MCHADHFGGKEWHIFYIEILNTILFYFGWLMIAVYVAIGLILIFSDLLINIVSQYRLALGIVFVIYAGFRAVMIVQKIKKDNNEISEL